MGISKLTALFAYNTDAVRQQRNSEIRESEQRDTKNIARAQIRQRTESASTPSVSQQVPPNDAAIVSQSIRTSVQQNSSASDSTRAERVQKLKSQVQNGTYQSDSEKVAVAVMKELA